MGEMVGSLGDVAKTPKQSATRVWLATAADETRGYAQAFGIAMVFTVAVICLLGIFSTSVPTLVLLVGTFLLLCWLAPRIPGVWPPSEKGTSAKKAAGRFRTVLVTVWSRACNLIPDNLAVTYALCCFGFATAAVFVPTVVCFVGAFEASEENALRIEQRQATLPYGCALPADRKKSACPVPMAPEPQGGKPPDVSDHRLPRWAEQTLWPMSLLVHCASPDVLQVASRKPDSQSTYFFDTRSADVSLVSSDRVWSLTSHIPRLVSWRRFWALILWGAALVTVLVGVYALAYFSLKRLFFMDVLVDLSRLPKMVPALPEGARSLVVFPSADYVVPEGAIVLTPEQFDDAKSNVLSLVDVEEAAKQASALVVAGVDPLRRAPAELRRRWIRALSGFTFVHGRGVGSASLGSNDANIARGWDDSDPDEQRVLGRLAFDGHVSPHPNNAAVLRHLAGRGLLDPNTLTIASEQLAQFVQAAVPPEQVYAWGAGETDVAWSIVRVPLVASVTLVVGLVSMTHPELAESGALLVPPIAGGLPAVIHLVATLVGGSSAPKA